jgi:hypothetical protein
MDRGYIDIERLHGFGRTCVTTLSLAHQYFALATIYAL